MGASGLERRVFQHHDKRPPGPSGLTMMVDRRVVSL
jgi:hypothetical protein